MFHNILAATLRNLARNRLYALINVVGLGAGFAAAILIGLYVRDELSYDRFFPDHERIFRVYGMFTPVVGNSTPREGDQSPRGTADWMKLEFPEVEHAVQVSPQQRVVRRSEIEAEETIWWSEPALFEIFRLPVIAGDLSTALSRPDGLVLTRSMARKYFGRDDPLGETLEIDRQHILRVAAVLEDLPSNTHLTFQIIGSSKAALFGLPGGPAFGPGGPVYLKLAPGADSHAIDARLDEVIPRHVNLTQQGQGFRVSAEFHMYLLPIAAIHLHRVSTNGIFDPEPKYGTLGALAAIGALILLVASINFINLATARNWRRATEVGVRKAAGAAKSNLMAQFLGEAMIQAVLGTMFALALVELLLPSFNGFLDRNIALDYLSRPSGPIVLLSIALAVGLLAGAYPALIAAAFRPLSAIRSGRGGSIGSGTVRRGLVVLQFAVLIGLLIATTVIYRQTAFAMGEAVGLDTDRMAVIRTDCANAFREKVEALPGVLGVACSVAAPLGTDARTGGGAPGVQAMMFDFSRVDFGFFELYGIAPIAGRLFDPDRATDAVRPDDAKAGSATIINEEMRRRFGFASAADAIGKMHNMVRAIPNQPLAPVPAEIIGVVPDFPVGTVDEAVEPTVFYVEPGNFRLMNVKLAGGTIPSTVEAIGNIWREVGEPRPIDLTFVDQHVQELYSGLSRIGTLLALFAGIAVLIGSLGLFGAAVFTAERRTKEIGVRKATGANSSDILRLLSWDFAKPVLWANLIAWPIAYYAMQRWLEGFAYHIELQLWMFASAGMLALLIALATVSVHSWLVARAKPVNALRYE